MAPLVSLVMGFPSRRQRGKVDRPSNFTVMPDRPEDRQHTGFAAPAINSISAVTLATHDMGRAVRFYRSLGFSLRYGNEDSDFTSFPVGSSYLNLVGQPKDRQWSWWGRIVFYVSDVDALYESAVANGLDPDSTPRDAEWGERYFHLTDPDGHQLSFAKRLASPP